MNIKLIWVGLSIVIVSTTTPLMISERANTAVPPLSSQNLNQLSDYIVIGTVTRIQRSELPMKFGSNYHYKVLVKVKKLELKDSNSLPSSNLKRQAMISKTRPLPGNTIEVHYWTVGKRQNGWTGAQGQNSHLKEGTIAKLFVRKDEKNALHLLEPNGWEPID
jgi:hypothetical protein